MIVSSAALVLGCAANIGAPQSRDEFVKVIKNGGLFASSEQTIVNRPFKTVAGDLKEYADKCLNVRTTRGPDYKLRESGGATKYTARMEATGKDVAALSLQEEYNNPNDRVNSGAPAGGIFVLVAEIRPIGSNRTQLDVYRAARGSIADFLKKWAAGDKSRCPALS